ncbi:MAG: hypothetical protein QOC82_1019 [Frankiaceae bacterium]|nr:hypothetical protein [Frankiaceae bacterium]MDQ1699391.1 hypothetical protein [Frankiaceae bacterium]
MTLQTKYEFVLPRGYVDDNGAVHRKGVMRLATARDELDPLRDPTITGPDDPRLTILVLARVVESLGTLGMVTPHEIEGLFAADLAFLQDFYGVINFGSQEEYHALLAAQQSSSPPPTPIDPEAAAPAATPVGGDSAPSASADVSVVAGEAEGGQAMAESMAGSRPRRSAIEEIPAGR